MPSPPGHHSLCPVSLMAVHDFTKLSSSSSLETQPHHLEEDTINSNNSHSSTNSHMPHKFSGHHATTNDESVSIDLKQIRQTAAKHGKAEPHADVMKAASDDNFKKTAHSTDKSEFTHSEQRAEFWNYILLLWMNPAINKGFETPITLDKTPLRNLDYAGQLTTISD